MSRWDFYPHLSTVVSSALPLSYGPSFLSSFVQQWHGGGDVLARESRDLARAHLPLTGHSQSAQTAQAICVHLCHLWTSFLMRQGRQRLVPHSAQICFPFSLFPLPFLIPPTKNPTRS